MQSIIKEIAEKAVEQPENIFTKSFFSEHIMVVKKYGCELGSIFNADNEIISIAAYLHDISAVLDYSTLAKHNTKSAEIAEDYLHNMNYQADKINIIKRCIISHTNPLQLNEGDIYEVIISNADAMAQIAVPSYWLYFAFKIKGLDYIEGLKWYREKIEFNWNALIPEAKKIIHNVYNNSIMILSRECIAH